MTLRNGVLDAIFDNRNGFTRKKPKKDKTLRFKIRDIITVDLIKMHYIGFGKLTEIEAEIIGYYVPDIGLRGYYIKPTELKYEGDLVIYPDEIKEKKVLFT